MHNVPFVSVSAIPSYVVEVSIPNYITHTVSPNLNPHRVNGLSRINNDANSAHPANATDSPNAACTASSYDARTIARTGASSVSNESSERRTAWAIWGRPCMSMSVRRQSGRTVPHLLDVHVQPVQPLTQQRAQAVLHERAAERDPTTDPSERNR